MAAHPTIRFRRRLQEGPVVVNGWLSTESRYLAEVLSHVGYDALTVDLQHGMFDVGTAIGLMQAVSAGPALVMARSPTLDAPTIGKLLDGGAWGIVCPAIETAEMCAEFVAACHYPPSGQRSFGPARGLLVGGGDYAALANASVMTWAMVESRTALENLDQIAATEGLDGIFVGPKDLALSLGYSLSGALGSGPLRDPLMEILLACRDAGRFSGVFAADTESAAWLAQIGYNLITPGNDVTLVREAAERRIAAVQRAARGDDGPFVDKSPM